MMGIDPGHVGFPVFSENDSRFRERFNFRRPSDNNYFRDDPSLDDPVLVTTLREFSTLDWGGPGELWSTVKVHIIPHGVQSR